MKTIFLICGLTLFLVGCDQGKNHAGATGSGAGIEQKQEYRNDYKVDDANITTPIDGRPDLEEEE